MLFIIVPIGLLFLWFTYELTTGEYADSGIMTPGITVALIGIVLLAAISTIGGVAMSAASIGSSIAQALSAPPADAVVISSLCVYIALMFLPLWY